MTTARPRWGLLVGGFLTGAALTFALVGEFWAGLVDDARDDRAITSLPPGCALLPDRVAGRWLPGTRAEVIDGHGWSRECRWRTGDRATLDRTNPTLRLEASLTERLDSGSAREEAQREFYGYEGVGEALSGLSYAGTDDAEDAGDGTPVPGLRLVGGLGDEAVLHVEHVREKKEITVTVYARKANVWLAASYHAFDVEEDAATQVARTAAATAVSRL